MAIKNKQSWNIGSVFLLPLKDGDECIGQIIGREPSVLNSVAVAFFDVKGEWSKSHDLPHLDVDKIFSVVFVTKDFLDSGRWVVLDSRYVGLRAEDRPYENLRNNGFIGAKVRGSANIEEFANAFYGLMPWDDWYVPDYLDDFLISPSKKPHDRLVFSGRH